MVQKEGSITLINLEEGYLQYFWHQGAKHSDEIPAGTYVTQVTEEEFKRNLTGQPNLLLRADSVNLRSGADLYLQAGVIEENTNLTGIKIFKGGLEAGTFNSDDYIYAWGGEDRNDRTISINSSEDKNDWRLIAGRKFGVDKAGNLYAENVHISGTVTVGAGSNVYTTDDTNPLLIGGRNLHKDSEGLGDSWAKDVGANVSNGVATIVYTAGQNCRIYQMPANGYWGIWEANTTYTISVEAKANTNGVTLSLEPYAGGIPGKSCSLTTEWKRYSYTFTSGNTTSTSSCTYKVTSNGTVQLRKPKLEKGNKATDWTPAPEDVQAEIDNIDIGGRNLLRNSTTSGMTLSPKVTIELEDDENYFKFNQTVKDWTSFWFCPGIPFQKVNGREITVSFEVRGYDLPSVPEANWFYVNPTTYESVYADTPRIKYLNKSYSSNVLTANKWVKISYTLTVDTSSWSTQGTGTINYLSLGVFNYSGKRIDFRRFKLEYGNKATDWTPAIEDAQADTNLALTPMAEWKSNYHCARINLSENLVANQTYTLQIWDVTINNTPAGGGLAVYWGGGMVSLVPNKAPDSTGYWTATFVPTAEQAAHADAKRWYLNIYNTTPNSEKTARDCTFSKVKLQKGAIGTQWSECPASSGNGKNLLYGTASMWNGGGNYKTKTFRYTGQLGGALSHMTFSSVQDKNGLPEGLTGFIRVTNTGSSAISGDMGIAQDGFTGDVNFTGGQTYTLSCWVRSNKRDYTIALQPIWSSGGTTGRKSVATTDTVWQYVSATLTLDTAQQTSYSGGYVLLNGTIAAGDYIDIAGVKLEEGPYATGWNERGEYITYIDATNGIRVYSGIDVTDYLQLNSDAITMVRNNVIRMRQDDTSLIFYDGGNAARLQLNSSQGLITGRTDRGYTQTTDSGFYIYNGASTQTNKKLAQVTGAGLEVFDAADGSSAAIFGATARIGKLGTNKRNVYVTDSAVQIRNNTTVLASYGDSVILYNPTTTNKAVEITSTGASFTGAITATSLKIGNDNTSITTSAILNTNVQSQNFAQGTMMYKDPTFASGVNSTARYANTNPDNVTWTRAAKSSDNPMTGTSYEMVSKNTGASSPGLGGFYFGHASRANAVFLYRIIAKIPTGRKIQFASNGTGDSPVRQWLTPQDGTGKFTEYVCKQICGSTGTFSTSGYFYIDGNPGTTSAPVTWYVAYATVFDMSTVSELNNYVGITSSGIRIASANPLTQSQRLELTNSALTIAYSDTYKTIVKSDGIHVYAGDASNSIAFFGETARIGKDSSITAHLKIINTGLNFYRNNTVKPFLYTGFTNGSVGGVIEVDQALAYGQSVTVTIPTVAAGQIIVSVVVEAMGSRIYEDYSFTIGTASSGITLDYNGNSTFTMNDDFVDYVAIKTIKWGSAAVGYGYLNIGETNSSDTDFLFRVIGASGTPTFKIAPTGVVTVNNDLYANNIGKTNVSAGTGAQKTGVSIPSGTCTPITSIIIPSGVWMITYLVRFSASGSGIRLCNMAQTRGSTWRFATAVPVPTGQTALNGTQFVNLSRPTIYYFNAYQNSGSALTADLEYWQIQIK